MTDKSANKSAQSAGLASELRRQFSEIMGVALFSSVANLLLFVVPIYSMQVYDRVLSSGSTETLAMLTLMGVAGLLFYGVLDTIRSRLLMRLGVRLEQDLSGPLLAHEISHTERGKPVTGAALKDLKEVSGYIGSANFASLIDIPWAPVFTLLLFAIHPTLGLIAIASSFMLLGLGVISDRWTSKSTENARGSASVMNRTTEELLHNAELLRAMGVTKHAIDRWSRFNVQAIEYYMTSGDRIALLSATARVLRQGVQIALTGFGIMLALRQELTVGVVFAASLLLGRALGPLENSITAFKSFTSARAAWGRLDLVLKQLSEREASAKVELPEPRGHVALSGMTVKVDGRDLPILDQITFELPAGQVLGIIGPSGSGKSTLMRYLAGVVLPVQGTIRLDGSELKDWPPEQLGRNIGYLPQEVELLTGTVADNIACFDPDMNSHEVIAAATAANLHDVITKLPRGYNTQVGPHGALLSAGQRQRVGLARAFYRNRKILILDEPNAHLDAEGERQLSLSVDNARKRGCTVIVATHRMQILNVVDRIAMLENGKLVKYGLARDVVAWVQSRNSKAQAASTPVKVAPPPQSAHEVQSTQNDSQVSQKTSPVQPQSPADNVAGAGRAELVAPRESDSAAALAEPHGPMLPRSQASSESAESAKRSSGEVATIAVAPPVTVPIEQSREDQGRALASIAQSRPERGADRAPSVGGGVHGLSAVLERPSKSEVVSQLLQTAMSSDPSQDDRVKKQAQSKRVERSTPISLVTQLKHDAASIAATSSKAEQVSGVTVAEGASPDVEARRVARRTNRPDATDRASAEPSGLSERRRGRKRRSRVEGVDVVQGELAPIETVRARQEIADKREEVAKDSERVVASTLSAIGPESCGDAYAVSEVSGASPKRSGKAATSTRARSRTRGTAKR